MEAARVLLENGISGAPVIDAEGRMLGVLSEFDCIREVASGQYHEDHDSKYTAADLMTREVHTLGPDTDLFGVASQMVAHRVRRLPVVEDGKVIGQISRRDVFRALFDYLRRSQAAGRYPDYPRDRKPIQDYPTRS
jgi:CBS domain-containing protein